MTVTVAATDIANYALQAQITAVQTLVNAPTVNPAQLFANTLLLAQLQAQLVANLMANTYAKNGPGNVAAGTMAYLNPATILSTCSVNT